MLQPGPAHFKFERLWVEAANERTNAIGQVVGRHQRERIDRADAKQSRRQIDTGHDGDSDCQRNMYRQRQKTDCEARCQAARHAAALQRPEFRV